MKKMNILTRHINPETLTNFAEKLLSAGEREKVQNHLNECPHCANELAMTEKVLFLMKADDSAPAPAVAKNWAVNLFRTRKAFQPKATVTQKILAVLQMDLLPEMVFGERSASAAAVRQMLYQADDESLDLRIKETAEGFIINGQILGENWENGQIEIFNNDLSITEKLNKMAEFALPSVPAGEYNLRLQNGEKEILIEKIVIK
jgi:hypothetical protein